MSHQTTVINATENVYIESCNKARKAAGLAALPPGTPVSKITKSMEQTLSKQVAAKWKAVYGGSTDNNDFGFIYPTKDLSAGTAPKCVVDQINLDFKNWQLPGTTDTGDDITKTITTELVAQGGLMGTAHGSVQVNSNETINWLVGYASVNISGSVGGYLYYYCADVSF